MHFLAHKKKNTTDGSIAIDCSLKKHATPKTIPSSQQSKTRNIKMESRKILANKTNKSTEIYQQIQDKISLNHKKQEKQKKSQKKLKTKKSQDKKLNQNDIIIEKQQSQRNENKKRKIITLPKEEYLFLGDNFFIVNKMGVNQKLLNTFRQACLDSSTPNSKKQIQQDSIHKSRMRNQKLVLNAKRNIFFEAKKQIKEVLMTKSACVIQKWWKTILYQKTIINGNITPSNQTLNMSEQQFDFQQFRAKLKIFQPNTSHKNSSQSRQEMQKIQILNLPQKISIKQQKQNEGIILTYKLPQMEINHQQNQQIFQNPSNSCKIIRISQSDEEEDIKEEANKQKIQLTCENTQNKQFFQNLKQSPNNQNELDTIIQMLEQRLRVQMTGNFQQIQSSKKLGIDTSIPAIHNFLYRFFRFYCYHYSDDLYRNINALCGHNALVRLAMLRGQPEPNQPYHCQDEGIFGIHKIISEEAIEHYYYQQAKIKQTVTSFAKANYQLQKVHQRAIIDHFNQQINAFRPYHESANEPFPWTHNYSLLSFYFVTESNIQEVFQTAQIQTLKICSSLCGLIVPQVKINQFNTFSKHYQKNKKFLIENTNESRFMKALKCENEKEYKKFYNDEEIKTNLMLQISSLIGEQLLDEIIIIFLN